MSEEKRDKHVKPQAILEIEGRTLLVDFGVPAGANFRGGRFFSAEESTDDEVEEASKQSFPASDAPGFNP